MSQMMSPKTLLLIGTVVLLGGGALWVFGATPSCASKLVCDEASLFNPPQEKALGDYHQALLERYDIDYRVAAISGVGDINEQAVAFFKDAAIGERSQSRKGLLLLINPQQNKVRLEVSAGLDAVYTDSFVAYLQQRQMVPFFQANRVADGILATTELIVERAQKAAAGEEFIPPSVLPQNLAIGAGAQTAASIGSGYDAPVPATSPQQAVAQGLTPEQVVAAYHQALANGNASPDLPIYTQESQTLKRSWVVTPAQMANELAMYRGCTFDKTIQLHDTPLAVVRYKVDQRKCAPYFLQLEDGQWKLDFVTMMNSIRFNVDNEWHLDMKKELAYFDAMRDWTFNKNGYPFPRPKMRWGIHVETDKRTDITTVSHIYAGTPAESMGLLQGDVIMQWNGIPAPSYKDVIGSMDRLEAGQKFQVAITRAGQALTLTLTAPPKL